MIEEIYIDRKQYEIIEILLEEEMNDKTHRSKRVLNNYEFDTMAHRIVSRGKYFLKDCIDTSPA